VDVVLRFTSGFGGTVESKVSSIARQKECPIAMLTRKLHMEVSGTQAMCVGDREKHCTLENSGYGHDMETKRQGTSAKTASADVEVQKLD
jgi:hypothetical protein